MYPRIDSPMIDDILHFRVIRALLLLASPWTPPNQGQCRQAKCYRGTWVYVEWTKTCFSLDTNRLHPFKISQHFPLENGFWLQTLFHTLCFLAKSSLSDIPDEVIFLNSCINFPSTAKHQWNTSWSLSQIYLYVSHIWQNITSKALQSFSYEMVCISSRDYATYSVPGQVTNCQKVSGASVWFGLHAPFKIKNKTIRV